MKRFTLAAFLLLSGAVALRPALGFSLLGQFKVIANGYSRDWQVPALGYGVSGDIGGPMYPEEGYRWNVPVIYYAFDSSFLNFFGTNGMAAVEDAIAVFNNLPSMSQITNDGTRLYINGQPVPYETRRVNYTAQALGLIDLKSYTMTLLIEELGLAEPERWCFAMYARAAFPAFTNYTVVPLNFDPISLRPTNAVNQTHYTYIVLDPLAPIDYTDAIEIPANPAEVPVTSVAGFLTVDVFAFNNPIGSFFTGLTHDDVGGLRWLYNPNNLAIENLPTGTTVSSSFANGSLIGSPWTPVVTTNTTGLTNFPVPVPGGTNTNVVVAPTGLRQGINKLKFQRVSYDSLLGQAFTPIISRWTDTIITNGVAVKIPVQRIVTVPDMIFQVQDLGPAVVFPVVARRTDTLGWTNNDAINGVTQLGGPGNIFPTIDFLYSENLPYFFNQNPDFRMEPPAPTVIWGSFDGTTNAPIIYPLYQGWTVAEIQQILRQRQSPRRSKRRRQEQI